MGALLPMLLGILGWGGGSMAMKLLLGQLGKAAGSKAAGAVGKGMAARMPALGRGLQAAKGLGAKELIGAKSIAGQWPKTALTGGRVARWPAAAATLGGGLAGSALGYGLLGGEGEQPRDPAMMLQQMQSQQVAQQLAMREALSQMLGSDVDLDELLAQFGQGGSHGGLI